MDNIDTEDGKVLLQHILRQAIDDYIKLQHPKYRRKKYLQEAFHNAIDMFFDTEYRFLHIQNDEGDDMSIEDFLRATTNGRRTEIEKLQEYVVEQANEYWDNKDLDTLTIPDTVIAYGNVYSVTHRDEPGYVVDYDKREIHTAKYPTGANQDLFLQAIVELACYHKDIRISRQKREELGHGLFSLLKVNNCFQIIS